jgi:hypothetical protein
VDVSRYAFAVETKSENSRWWSQEPDDAGAGLEESELNAPADFAVLVMGRWLAYLSEPSEDHEWMCQEDVPARVLVWDVYRVEADFESAPRPEDFTPHRYTKLLAANKIEPDAIHACAAEIVQASAVEGLTGVRPEYGRNGPRGLMVDR